MNRVTLAAVMILGALFFSIPGQAAAIKEGEWEMITAIHMAGMDDEMAQAHEEMEKMSPEERAMMEQMMGGMKMNMGGSGGGITTTMTQCLTNDNPVPQASEEEGCEETHSIRGNKVNFEVTCPKSHSIGEITYKNDTMKGTIQSTQKGETATINISGKYLGPCSESSSTPSQADKILSLREKELELKAKELELKERELNMQDDSDDTETTTTTTAQTKKKPSLSDVNNAVNTTNNVKSTFSGFKSLFGK